MFPDFEIDYDFVSLSHPDEYPMNEGLVVSSRGDSWTPEQFEEEFVERQVPHSTALQAVRRSTGLGYFVGPLARVRHNFDRLSSSARRCADEVGFRPDCRNPFRSIIARGLELVHAYDEALEILRTYRPSKSPRVPVVVADTEGCAATEAPRGLLYHRYRVDGDGKIAVAKIVPPTSQNQAQIENDLAAWLPRVLDEPENVAQSCERMVRNYDPCISCATHFLSIRWERQ